LGGRFKKEKNLFKRRKQLKEKKSMVDWLGLILREGSKKDKKTDWEGKGGAMKRGVPSEEKKKSLAVIAS